MADLVGGGGIPATSNGGTMPAPRRPTGAPAPTSSPSGIRGPRMIMQERAAREARQKAEAERQQLERARAEQEARLQQEAQRTAAERRHVGVATNLDNTAPFTEPQRQTETAQPAVAAPTTPRTSHQRTNTGQYATNQQIPSQVYAGQQPPHQSQPPPHPQSQPQTQRPSQTQSGAQRSPPRTVPVQSGGDVSAQPATAGTSGSSKPRNSFPHAFERWETLSAHWEGLTSYWIRKLEQNKDELNRDPVSQQLARQVTDLSAAGANLFHAVVELQRLRASSERKFQRWFFETRGELERAQEVNTMLENALDQERRNRDEAIREALEKDQGTSQAQKQLAEMRKELAISKDEARRAWEELGRREQTERDRLLSLQSGHPTIVGGVQVVPMTHGAPGRQASARDPGSYQGHTSGPASPSPAGGPEGYYRKQEAGQPQTAYGPGVSEGGFSGGEYVTDVQGRYILDVNGNKIPLAAPPSTCSGSDAEVEEYETPATTNPPSGSYEPPNSSSAPESQWTGAYSDTQGDYSGQGYAAPGWETVPRHHHPTRLSDVIEEEDERSRTSASQVSRR
ncbi:hypothetical protein ACRE_065570 [Hapsidospora chrysogenum ATCC 11550]|uniref:Uncharacterized protein n=1 Tax=Hapsidospora chrysogenum (strain ATCC 11550 / CBS 779.69 / DSM 880 / IAM 14645 / JCM 23072 / IMI 49137) TaxID=857340 RepID=A0A086T018_HAPC1|nr:hypothetical protein ACRE_065570 [Hapsidospora chrysogenum ATCC 11550]